MGVNGEEWIEMLATNAATWVTAIATVVLALLTFVLAKATRAMALSMRQPNVVVSLEPCIWSLIHLDIVVHNTGNAPAYDVRVKFSPGLPNAPARKDSPPPFNEFSIIRPGQVLTSFVSNFSDVQGKRFRVSISWATKPKARRRDSLDYDIDLSFYDGISYLGERTPEIQIAKEIKKIRDDWRFVATGQRRLSVDSFMSADREAERDALERRFRGEDTA